MIKCKQKSVDAYLDLVKKIQKQMAEEVPSTA